MKTKKKIIVSAVVGGFLITALGKKISERKKKRKTWSRNWLRERSDGKGVLAMLDSELLLEDPISYRNYLRMNSAQFKYVLGLIENSIKKQDTHFREAISSKNRLEITLRYLATGETFRSLMYATRIHESTISRIIPEVCDAIYEALKGIYLQADDGIENVDNTIKPRSEIDIPLAISENSDSSIEKFSIGRHNNNRNSISNSNLSDQKCINEKIVEKRSVHDEEKEIMRKTKENINRKSRPIMKYVDDTNNTLNIGKNDNVNNWEDLFDDQGHLHEDLIKEIIHKVGTEVTIVKAKEDYSDYCVKQIEELEHMVELYDFPASLETNDLIHAFREINSDAMYIKWVDNTHAILVLGSLTQAQKAIGISNPLIKVRPMTAASNVSLATAYKHELKPAMKRPQTNLQTARRLITTHLGAKSTVSREKSAKERDDLREARELKKLLKKNEQDAWEGNLRSSLH